MAGAGRAGQRRYMCGGSAGDQCREGASQPPRLVLVLKARLPFVGAARDPSGLAMGGGRQGAMPGQGRVEASVEGPRGRKGLKEVLVGQRPWCP